MRDIRILYLLHDYNQPSWGVGLVYRHAHLLRRLGFDAAVLHQRSPFAVGWMDVDVPILHLDNLHPLPRPQDILVVPEVLASEASELRFQCRHIVFVQGSFLIHRGLGSRSYAELGYERAMVTLPHLREIIEQHYQLDAQIVPPCIAPYFFQGVEGTEREPRILLFPKPDYRSVGYLDYDILKDILERKLRSSAPAHPWRLEEVRGRTHREVADLMKRSAFVVSVNCLEGFNATVPEAMAAGCIAVCYEGCGGKDFLRDGENAFVLPNNHVYSLAARLFELMDYYWSQPRRLACTRRRAFETARRFSEENTLCALRSFYASLGCNPAA